jgi:hypothetical protein
MGTGLISTRLACKRGGGSLGKAHSADLCSLGLSWRAHLYMRASCRRREEESRREWARRQAEETSRKVLEEEKKKDAAWRQAVAQVHLRTCVLEVPFLSPLALLCVLRCTCPDAQEGASRRHQKSCCRQRFVGLGHTRWEARGSSPGEGEGHDGSPAAHRGSQPGLPALLSLRLQPRWPHSSSQRSIEVSVGPCAEMWSMQPAKPTGQFVERRAQWGGLQRLCLAACSLYRAAGPGGR